MKKKAHRITRVYHANWSIPETKFMSEELLIVFVKNWIRRPSLYTFIELDGKKLALDELAGIMLIKGMI